jgi:hypothetical protein
MESVDVEERREKVVGAVLGVLGRESVELEDSDELDSESESESEISSMDMDERGDGTVRAVVGVLGREKLEDCVDESESESESLFALTTESSAWELMLCLLLLCLLLSR